MKIANRFFFAIILIFCGKILACKSAQFFVEDMSPVAILSVTSNSQILWENEEGSDDEDDDEGTSLLTGLLSRATGRKNPEIALRQDRVDYAAQALHDLFLFTGNATTIDHETLKASAAYEEVHRNFFEYLTVIEIANDYKSLMGIGTKSARMILDEVGAKSALMAHFTFNKRLVSGTKWKGQVGVVVKLKVRYLDSAGKEILNKEFSAVSDTIPIAKGKYSKEDLVELIPAAIDSAINIFLFEHIK